MRRRIAWLVLATTSAIVVAFVIPLGLLVRTLAEDRALARCGPGRAATSPAWLPAASTSRTSTDAVEMPRQRSVGRSRVYCPTARAGPGDLGGRDDDEQCAGPGGAAFTVVDASGGRVLLPVVTPDGTAVVPRERRPRTAARRREPGLG